MKLLDLASSLCEHHPKDWVSLVAQMVKNLPAMWETWLPSLGWEDPLEKSMDRGAWQVTVHGVTRSQTQMND